MELGEMDGASGATGTVTLKKRTRHHDCLRPDQERANATEPGCKQTAFQCTRCACSDLDANDSALHSTGRCETDGGGGWGWAVGGGRRGEKKKETEGQMNLT